MASLHQNQRADVPRRGDAPLDVDALREQFPVLDQEVNGKPLIYLDNAATSQTPRMVIDAIREFYERDCANIHRGVHTLSQRATERYEGARESVRRFIGARDTAEIIFLRGTTEAINLVAQSWGRANVSNGDEIVISALEHHSNIVPWQMLCEQVGAELRVIPIDDRGQLMLDAFEGLLSERTKLVAVAHVSNALGTVNPVREITERAHARGVPVLLDGAQALPHQPVDVADLDCDFYAFSAHKLYGPTGVGVLYGKRELLESMPPWQGGGDMIASVTFEKTRYNVLPYRFEAGTPNIAGGIGLGAAIAFLEEIGMDRVAAYEQHLLRLATRALEEVPGVRMIGTADEKAAVCSFVLEGIHPHDIGTILDQEGVAIRTGHHCAQPVMQRFGVPATARASFGVYNTPAEIEALVRGLHKTREIFQL